MSYYFIKPYINLNVTSHYKHGQKGEDQKMLCCLCCASGPITAEFTIDRSGYVPGEFITISGEVDNFSNKHMSSTSVELRMVGCLAFWRWLCVYCIGVYLQMYLVIVIQSHDNTVT